MSILTLNLAQILQIPLSLRFYNAAKTDCYDYWKVVLPDDGVLSIETTSDATLILI